MKKIYEYPKTPEIPKPKVKVRIHKFHPDKIFTFSSERTPAQLKQLRQSLIKENFISDNITDDQFIYIFTGQLVVDYMVPIKWKIRRGGKTALKYFLELLFIPVHKNQVKNCFIDADGKPFEISKPNRINGNYGDKLEKICNF